MFPIISGAGKVSWWVERCRHLGKERTTALLQIEQRIQDEVGAALGVETDGSSAVERSMVTLFGNAHYEYAVTQKTPSARLGAPSSSI